MIPTPHGPDIPIPPPIPEPGGREPSTVALAYKVWDDLENLKKQVAALLARLEGLERRVASLESGTGT